eukprot:5832232-Prymnesium_polylepis.1
MQWLAGAAECAEVQQEVCARNGVPRCMRRASHVRRTACVTAHMYGAARMACGVVRGAWCVVRGAWCVVR